MPTYLKLIISTLALVVAALMFWVDTRSGTPGISGAAAFSGNSRIPTSHDDPACGTRGRTHPRLSQSSATGPGTRPGFVRNTRKRPRRRGAGRRRAGRRRDTTCTPVDL